MKKIGGGIGSQDYKSERNREAQLTVSQMNIRDTVMYRSGSRDKESGFATGSYQNLKDSAIGYKLGMGRKDINKKVKSKRHGFTKR